jgi:GNAT superfamily N-acetyltransferase
MLIRHAHPGEGVSIAPCYEWLFAPPGSEPLDYSSAVSIGRLEDTISGDSSTILLATDGERIQGFATVYLDIVSVRFGQRAWIEDLAVATPQRSIGVGKTLLDQAKEWAKETLLISSWSRGRHAAEPMSSIGESNHERSPAASSGDCSG